jgi:hypothetical protein
LLDLCSLNFTEQLLKEEKKDTGGGASGRKPTQIGGLSFAALFCLIELFYPYHNHIHQIKIFLKLNEDILHCYSDLLDFYNNHY